MKVTLDTLLRDCKPDYIRADKQDVKSAILERLRHQSLKSKKREMRHKWLLPTIIAPVVLLTIAGFTHAWQNTISLTQTSIDRAIRTAHFDVKQPTLIPFSVTQSWGQVTTVIKGGSNGTEVSIVYANKRKTLTENVSPTSSGLINIPKNQQTVYMGNGRAAIYVKANGSLYWQQGNETYSLIVHPFNLVSEAELIKIADSVK